MEDKEGVVAQPKMVFWESSGNFVLYLLVISKHLLNLLDEGGNNN